MSSYEDQIDALLAEDIDSVKEREQTAFDRLLAGTDGRLVLFGAGNLGRKALRSLRSAGIEPLAFADNNRARWGTETAQLHVLPPIEAAEKYGESALFVVTIWLVGHAFRSTRSQLEELGCQHIVSATSLRWKFADELLPDHCHDSPHKVIEQAMEVKAASGIWADEESQIEYARQLHWRLHGDHNRLGGDHRERIYFPDSIFLPAAGEIVLDCGAFDGDTARDIMERNPAYSEIICCEPDPSNYERCLTWLHGLREEHRIIVHNLAVGAKREELKFRALGTEGSSIQIDGETSILSVPIDELIAGQVPTYIKMDIEGAELAALEGARHTIRTGRPVLAISVDHRQNDLWRIPLFIRSLRTDYKLFLRQHFADGWDVVCYAVPPHRLRSAVKGSAG